MRCIIVDRKNANSLRRLCEGAGLRVTRLKRVAEGPLRLGELPVGAWRMLSQEELEALERSI